MLQSDYFPVQANKKTTAGDTSFNPNYLFSATKRELLIY